MPKKLIRLGCVIGTVSLAASGQAQTLNTANPDDAVEIIKRVQCGIGDAPAVLYWSGKIYSRVTGEPDRHLFNGEGMNIRRCVPVKDAKRGKGFRIVSREVMFYTDPKTDEILRTWTNPWTDETVEVVQIANDPVNQRPIFPRDAEGKPAPATRISRIGDWALMPLEVPLFYNNPLAGDYQEYVGNKYHAMEIFDFAVDAEKLFNTRYPTVYPTVSWVRISDWMPWMKMRGRQGQMVFNAMGAKVKSYDELPDSIKTEIAANYPEYESAPPADDTRPNATTWTVFKDWIDQKRKKEGGRPSNETEQH